MEKYPLEVFKKTLVDRYASKDELRPQYCKANDYFSKIDNVNYWCVTDCYILIFIPHHLIGPAGCSDVKIENAIPSTLLDSPVLFTLNEFKQALDKCHSEPGYDEIWDECPDCKGEGSTMNDDEDDWIGCEKCEGEGQIMTSKIPTGLIAYPIHDADNNQQVIQFLTAKFYPQILNRLVQCLELLQMQDSIIQVISHTQFGPTYMQIGEIKFLMMPVKDMDCSSYTLTKAILPAGADKI